MKKITAPGLIAGVISWILIMWYATAQSACLKTSSCDGGDLLLFAVIGIGMSTVYILIRLKMLGV